MVRKDDKPPEITAEGELAPQMGSDKTTMARGTFDMRRLSKINPIEKAWISFFRLEDGDDGKDHDLEGGGGFFFEFCEEYLNLSVSEDGWRTNKMIQMVAGAAGAPSVGELQKKPGWLGRNITQRGWKKDADEEGRTIVE